MILIYKRKVFFRKSTGLMPDYYMYIVEASGSTGKNTYWFISKEIGDTTYLLAGFEPNISCPDGNERLLHIEFHNHYLFQF